MTSSYKLEIDFGSSKVEGTGATVLEALQSIETPVKIVGKTFIKLTDGTRTLERMYLPARAKRLFYPNAQFFLAKNLEFLLK